MQCDYEPTCWIWWINKKSNIRKKDSTTKKSLVIKKGVFPPWNSKNVWLYKTKSSSHHAFNNILVWSALFFLGGNIQRKKREGQKRDNFLPIMKCHMSFNKLIEEFLNYFANQNVTHDDSISQISKTHNPTN